MMAHSAGGNTQHHCKDCNIFFDTSKSLDVHLQYHQENPLSKWGQPGASASSGSSSHGEDNNNFIKPGAKRQAGDFGAVTAPADSSDMQAFQQQGQNFQPFSPQFNFNNRNRSPTPNGMTNQGFNGSGSSGNGSGGAPQEFNGMRPPSENSAHAVKQEPASFNFNSQEQQGEPNGSSYILGHNDDFPVMAGRPPSTPNSLPPPSPQSSQMSIPTSTPSYRFHPYGGHPHMSAQYSDRNVVSSSSPVPRPSPAPSPQHCEKCGFMCPSREALRDHQALAHPPQQQPGFQQFPGFRPPIKSDDEESQILDLDSQKVHNVYQQQQDEEERRRQMGGQHSVSALLNWVDNNAPPGQPQGPPQGQPQMWQRNGMLPGMPPNGPMSGPPMVGGPPGYNPPHHGMQVPQPQYQHRPYLPPDAGVNGGPGGPGNPGMPQQLITSSQAPNPMSPGLEGGNSKPLSGGKVGNAAWKSNEARRPKTYHCSACNKWFTSSGHLKRHYNTTLHKNAVKQSGAPDPASLPVSSHHHPERDPKHSNGSKRATPVNLDSSASPAPSSGGGEESSPSDDASHSNGFGRTTPVQGSVQGMPPQQAPPQPPPGLPPQQMHMPPPPHQPHQLTTSPPNRLAGPSEMTTGGLLPMSPYHDLAPTSSALPGQPSPTPFLGVGLHPSLPPPLSAPHPIHQPPALHHFQAMQPTSMGPSMGPNQVGGHLPPSPMGGLHSTMTAYPNGLPPHDSTQTTLSTSHHHLHHLTSTTGESELRGPVLPPMPNFAQYPVYGVDPTLTGYGGYVVSASQNVGGLSPVPMADMLNAPPTEEGSTLTTLQQAQPSGAVATSDEMCLKIQDTFSMAPDEGDVKMVRPNTPPDFPTSTDDIMREKHLLQQKALQQQEPAGRKRKKRKTDETNSNVISSSTGSKLSPEGVTNMSGGLVFNSSMISEGDIHKCLDCDKQFNKACYLTQHNKSFHSGDKPFKCDRCGKRFPAEHLYEEHLGKHAGDKPYKCEICPKQFNHKTDLRRHLCLHSGEKPYACDVCGKGFIRKDHMIKHCDTHRKKPAPAMRDAMLHAQHAQHAQHAHIPA